MVWGHRRLVNWLRKNWAKSLLVLFFLGVAIWGSLMSHLGYVISNAEPWHYISSVMKDIGPELAGIVIGVVTIDYLNGRRQGQQLKDQLIMQMGSAYSDVADTAIRSLKVHGRFPPEDSWLTDGSLKGADLWRANLEGADLWSANLEGADLGRANLQEAKLWRANLEGADLWSANLQGAFLVAASLEGADLWRANLEGAKLWAANLEGAKLWAASLEGADLWSANLEGVNLLNSIQVASARNLQGAIMPDGTRLFTEGDRELAIVPCQDCPSFEEWLESQRQLPPDERAIIFKNEVDAAQEQPESASPDGAALTEDQADEIKRRAKEAAQGAGVHGNRVHSQIRQEFDVKSTNGLTQNQYPSVLELGNLSSLEELYLDYNRLSGAIPAELGNLSSLGNLHLNNNQLSGPIPTELSNLSNLYLLTLFDNPSLVCWQSEAALLWAQSLPKTKVLGYYGPDAVCSFVYLPFFISTGG